MMVIDGYLTTHSPVTIGAPGKFRRTIDGHWTSSSEAPPATRVVRWTAPPVPDHTDYFEYPVLSANTLRGALRRAAAGAIEDALVARGEKLSLPAYNVLRTGAAFGNPDGEAPNLKYIQRAATIPPLALFGGGPFLLRGSVRVDTGMPVVRQLVERGILPEDTVCYQPAESEEGADTTEEGSSSTKNRKRERLTMVLWRRRGDDAGAFIEPDTCERLIVNYAASMDGWQALTRIARGASEKKDGKKKKGRKGRGAAGEAEPSTVEESASDTQETADSSDSKNLRLLAALNAYEAIVPGVKFTFGVEAETEHEASLGYLLMGLSRFARAQRLGGNGRLGFGHFGLDLQATFADGAREKVFGPHYELNRSGSHIDRVVSAAAAWLDGLTAADLNALFETSAKGYQALEKAAGRMGGEAAVAFQAVMGS